MKRRHRKAHSGAGSQGLLRSWQGIEGLEAMVEINGQREIVRADVWSDTSVDECETAGGNCLRACTWKPDFTF